MLRPIPDRTQREQPRGLRVSEDWKARAVAVGVGVLVILGYLIIFASLMYPADGIAGVN